VGLARLAFTTDWDVVEDLALDFELSLFSMAILRPPRSELVEVVVAVVVVDDEDNDEDADNVALVGVW
jgi:hypothetical protein